MPKQFRVLDQFMASLGDKEATYNAGPAAWTIGPAYQLYEFGDAFVVWDDQIITDRDLVHGSQFATRSEIIRQDVRFVYNEPRVRPVPLAGFAALVGGTPTVAQDAALVAYRHKVVPVAADVALPSIAVQEKASAEQYMYYGVKCDTFALRRNGAFWSMEVGLIGSGTRAVSATAFPAKVTEVPLRWGDTYCWIETPAAITISATPTQGLEDISSGTPDALTTRLLDAEFRVSNDLQAEDGYAPAGGIVRSRLDHGPARGANIRLDVIVDPATIAAERAYYDSQVDVCVELENKSTVVVAATGAFYFGFDLIIPKVRLSPIARGVRDGFNIITLAGDCCDDGTNPLWILYTYNAQAAYLA